MEWLTDLFSPDEVSGWDIGVAVVVLVAALIVAHYAKRGVTALLGRLPGLRADLVSLCARLAKYGIILLAVGIDLALLGANVQPLLGAVIIVAAVGALALRGVAANFGAGVVIQARRSIHLGQQIEILGYTGTVTELNSRSVVISTFDGRSVHIPNASVLENPMINHSELGERRSSVEVRVVTSLPLDEVVKCIAASATSALESGSTAPVVLVRSASPDHSRFEVRVWHSPPNEASVTSTVVTSIYRGLTDRGITAIVTSPVPTAPLTPPPPL